MASTPAYRFQVFRDIYSPKLVMTSKNTGVGPITLYGTQRYLLDEIQEGLERGVHWFVILKGRQQGITTLLEQLNIFWLSIYPGLQGAMIFDDGKNLSTGRSMVTEILNSLPPGFRVGVKRNNRDELLLNNGSRLMYLSAGSGGNLGRSKGLNYCHSSECSSWKDQKGLDSLTDALSHTNPNRFYAFESTALGHNIFFDMAEDAKDDPSKKFIFLGWWRMEDYRYKKGTDEFKKWWGEWQHLTEFEAPRVALIKERYDFDITPEQIAWYRHKMHNRSEDSCLEENPWLEEDAWQASGKNFFNNKRLTEDMNALPKLCPFNGYSVKLGANFMKTQIVETADINVLDLRVWEEPKPGGKYVMGVDPSYASSEESDRCVISIWRCYADKAVQVAEYATNISTTQQCAWVMAYLAACYRGVMINLEINGPGAEVMSSIKHLKDQVNFGGLREIANGLGKGDVLDHIKWFLYHRVDSTGGGYAFNWKTSASTKEPLMNRYRDRYMEEEALARSIPLIDEMITIRQEGAKIEASGKNNDDRVIAAALAIWAWVEWIRPGMMSEGRTHKKETAMEQRIETEGRPDAVAITVQRYFMRRASGDYEGRARFLAEGNF